MYEGMQPRDEHDAAIGDWSCYGSYGQTAVVVRWGGKKIPSSYLEQVVLK